MFGEAKTAWLSSAGVAMLDVPYDVPISDGAYEPVPTLADGDVTFCGGSW